MAMSLVNRVGRVLQGRELQFRAVVITALCSYGLQLIGILLHWSLSAIAAVTILPWVPLFTVKILWSSKHYGFMALYLAIMILQFGHVMEHVAQMLQFIFIYNPAHGCFGWSWHGFCMDAHGIFGELNRELVHFVWDGLILVACIVVRIHFRKSKNIWLTLAIIAAAIHQIEHIYLFGTYLFMPDLYYHGGTNIFGQHIINGIAAQAGLMGYNGVVGTALPFLNPILPGRINLHFIYNVFVFIPMVLAFVKETQHIYDEWLAKAMPQLSEEQLIAATAQSENMRFMPGQIIFRQGDLADKFYIITRGQVDITRYAKKDGQEMLVGRLSEGQYFGEIEVLGRTERTVTARAVGMVECLALNREVFKSLMVASGQAYKDMDLLLRRRLVQLGSLQGLAVGDSVNADPNTILKTRMIRDRLKMLQGDDVSRILGRAPSSAQGAAVATLPRPSQPQLAVAMAENLPLVRASTPAPVPAVPLFSNGGFHRGALLVRSGPSAGLRYEINAPRIVVGRRSVTSSSSSADLNVPMMLIDDARISRQHLEIFARPDGLYAHDLGSANGTWLNGRQLGGEPVRLEDGAEISIGPDTVLSFRVN